MTAATVATGRAGAAYEPVFRNCSDVWPRTSLDAEIPGTLLIRSIERVFLNQPYPTRIATTETRSTRIDAVLAAAEAWTDPDFDARDAAVHETLHASNHFTEEAVAFAVNQLTNAVTRDALSAASDVLGSGDGSFDEMRERGAVGVRHGGRTPFDGFRESVAVWLSGRSYVGRLAEASPTLLPAFADTVRQHDASLDATFSTSDDDLTGVDALIAPTDDDLDGDALADRLGLDDAHRLVRGPLISVALIDGNETEDERHDLAEDVLLHEGNGPDAVKIAFAPRDHSPDAYLQAMADFRGVFPAHDDTPGALQMQQAFLEAQDEPHAYAAGLQFLVSRGDPVPQRGAHLRWAEYDDIGEAIDWIRDHAHGIRHVVAREALQNRLPDDWSVGPVLRPGQTHRQPLLTPDLSETLHFLSA